jgi:hypothetical protein
MESELLALSAVDGVHGHTISYRSTCEQIYSEADGSRGPCFWQSLFGPHTPWQHSPSSTNTTAAADVFFEMAESLGQRYNPRGVDGIHLAVTELHKQAGSDLFMSNILGGLETNGDGEVTKVGAVSVNLWMAGVEREALAFGLCPRPPGAVKRP